jgi:cell wall-associated NlpC family hydrolase
MSDDHAVGLAVPRLPFASLALGLALLAGCATAPRAPSAGASPATQHPQAPQALMVDSAEAMLGQPYRYGGAAPGGFDCSGLVVYAASSAGIRLPRTAEEQLRAGAPIRRSELRAGDLVFMHLAHKELHVGIAIDGERFIHAPSTGSRVRVDSLAAAPYSRSFLAARRVIAAPAPSSTR